MEGRGGGEEGDQISPGRGSFLGVLPLPSIIFGFSEWRRCMLRSFRSRFFRLMTDVSAVFTPRPPPLTLKHACFSFPSFQSGLLVRSRFFCEKRDLPTATESKPKGAIFFSF